MQEPLTLREVGHDHPLFEEYLALFGVKPNKSWSNQLDQKVSRIQLVGSGSGIKTYRSWHSLQLGNLDTPDFIACLAEAYGQPSLRLVQWPVDVNSEGRQRVPVLDQSQDRTLVAPGHLLEIDHPKQALSFFVDQYPLVAAWTEDSPYWILANLASGEVLRQLLHAIDAMKLHWSKDKKRYAAIFLTEESDIFRLSDTVSARFSLTLPMLLNQLGFESTDSLGTVLVDCKPDDLVLLTPG